MTASTSFNKKRVTLFQKSDRDDKKKENNNKGLLLTKCLLNFCSEPNLFRKLCGLFTLPVLNLELLDC